MLWHDLDTVSVDCCSLISTMTWLCSSRTYWYNSLYLLCYLVKGMTAGCFWICSREQSGLCDPSQLCGGILCLPASVSTIFPQTKRCSSCGRAPLLSVFCWANMFSKYVTLLRTVFQNNYLCNTHMDNISLCTVQFSFMWKLQVMTFIVLLEHKTSASWQVFHWLYLDWTYNQGKQLHVWTFLNITKGNNYMMVHISDWMVFRDTGFKRK